MKTRTTVIPRRSIKEKVKWFLQGRKKRVFKFRTEEADIYWIKYKGKYRIFRGLPLKKQAEQVHLRTQLFHALFPEYALRPVGFTSKFINGIPMYGTVTDPIIGRPPGYKLEQKAFYGGHGLNYKHRKTKADHVDFVKNTAKKISQRIHKSTGLQPNDYPTNVTQTPNGIKFFETYYMERKDIEKLKQYITINYPDVEEKKQLLAWAKKLVPRL